MHKQTPLIRIGRLAVVMLLAVLVLSGCAARNHLRKADTAAANGDMRSALYHYERALSHDDDLAGDDEFREKLAAAQTQVSYQDGVALRAEGHYEAAARKLHEALQTGPGYAPAAELLAVVNGEVADKRYADALASADRGSLDAAEEHLRVAMAHDPTDDRVVTALSSLRVELLTPATPGLAAYERGLSLSAERRWDAAGGAFREAVGLNTNLLPARAALADADQQLAESRRLSDSGAARLRESRVSVAVPLLEQSLAVWPFNKPAQSSLTQARALLAQADAKLADAVASAERSDWEAALAAADAGLVLDKSHPALREFRPDLIGRAAADYTRRGSDLAGQGELADARDAYLRALEYRPAHRPAQRGLAGVYHAWGAELEEAGRPGAALLYYNRGQRYMATADISQSRGRVLEAIYDNLGMSLAVQVGETPAGSAVSGNRLGDALNGAMQRHERAGLSLDPQQPRFVLVAEIDSAWVEQRRTGSDTRTHRYTVDELRPNPDYDRLVYDIECLREEVRCLERDYHDYLDRHRHHRHHGGDPAGHDRHLSDRHNRHLNDLDRRIRHKRRDLDRLYRVLRRTPRDVLVPVPYTTSYTVEAYTKTGGLTVNVHLVERATGEVIESFTEQGSSSHRDTSIPNPSPEIGIHPDPLSLPDDAQVASEIAHAASRSATNRAVEAAVLFELARLRAQAEELREQGDTDTALEVEAAAAVLVGLIDANASGRVLGTLGEANVE